MQNAIFDHSTQEAPGIFSFWFIAKARLNFIAGQYLEMTIKHNKSDNRGQKRWFTISSPPNVAPYFSVTTRLSSDAGSTFKQALKLLDPGLKVKISEAVGDFVLPKDPARPLIFIAGGIGITPFHSILSELSDNKEVRDIKLIYTANKEADIIFQNTFNNAQIHPTIVVANPSEAWGGERGQLSAELILDPEKPSDETLIYISGPEKMVENLEKDLKKSGIQKSQLIGDFFPGYQTI